MSEAEMNLRLWRSVETTDTKFVKPITGKAYKGTSPSPHWIKMRLTETFGPAGIGWGTKVLDERFETIGTKVMHYVRIQFWYVLNGKRGEVEECGGTEIGGVRKDGTAFADEDGPKKSMTDALVKAASALGFAADIFLGRWDDSKYVNELKLAEAKAEKAAKAKDPAPHQAIVTAMQPPATAAFPIIGPDALLYEIMAKDDQPAITRWMSKARTVIGLMESSAALRGWRVEMGPLLASISETEPEAVKAVEDAIEARLASFMVEPEMEGAP